jgi:hypothetical protein
MPAIAAPYGLLPVNHPSGVVRPFAMTIASGYAANIFQNQPVAIAANGTIVVPSASAAIIGAFQGVEFTDSDGRRRVSNKWTTGLVATDIVAYVTIDQTITYQIQGNGGASANTALTVADIGSQYDYTTASGNTTTGLSTIALDQATATTSGQKQLRLIGIVPGPNNAFGDNTIPFVDALVQISLHQNTAAVNAY